MIVDNETAMRRPELSAAKRALLEKRLRSELKSQLRTPGIPRRTTSSPAPLSFAQQRLWFFHQLASESPLYNVSLALRLQGRLDREALEKSLATIVARHESLRTRFLCAEGEAAQVIDEPPPAPLRLVDLSDLTVSRHEAEIQRLFKEEASRPFNLSKDLLLRPVLARLSDTDHALLLTLHHIASDGWSLSVLFRELTAVYEAFADARPPALPELPIQYADFAAWQRNWMQGELLHEQLAYWKRQLAGAPDLLNLPTDRPRPVVQTFRGRWHWKTFPKPLAAALKALSQREGATLFMTLVAAFQALLHRYTGQPDILIGSPIAGRNQIETEGLIGFFINTLVLRGNLSGDPTFCELLQRVRETTLGAYAHQDLPFERLVEELHPARTSSHSPLVQVLFVLQNAPDQTLALPGLAITPIPVDKMDTGTAKFDLALQVDEDGQGMRAAVEYNTDLFDDATIVRLVGHFQTLLEGITANPDRRLSKLPLLTPAERSQLLIEWNDTRTHYPRGKTIPELFAEQVADHPDTIAVSFEEWHLTYGELDVYANQLAHFLQRQGVGPDTLVGVCLERSVDMIVALLGILKAGGAYVSLDPAHPKERLALMLEESQAPVLLTQEKLRNALPDLAGQCPSNSPSSVPMVVCLDAGWSVIAQESSAAPASRTTAENLAYVSYTSGSTGEPKGVCVPHRGVVRLVKETNYARFGPDEVFLQLAPIAFDASTLEIWGPLLNGGRLVVFPRHTPSLAELGEVIQRNRITTLWLASGLFHQMVEEQLDSLKGVRQLLAGGDVLSVSHVAKALEKLSRTQLINGYGPTENTTFTCCHRITAPLPPNRSIPIGRPVANTQVYVLDEHLQPAPIGVPGELYIGGDGLARGYLNRPELTANRFIDNPFSTEAERGCPPQQSRRISALESDPNAMLYAGAEEEDSRAPEAGSADVPARLYKTGDRVRWLPDGTIEFLGRTDRQVKIRGFRIELEEIETVLAEHPSVKDTVVVVREDKPGDKRLVAYVVADQLPPTLAELRQFLQKKIPDYMVPSAFATLAALPLNSNGKVDRDALPAPDMSRATSGTEFAAPLDGMEKRLVQIWENVLNGRPVGIRDNFFELGGHSLLAVRLMARIEREFGKKLPLAVLFQAPTVEHLADVLRDRQPAVTCSSLVAIQPKGSKPPIFLVHGVGGGMFWGYANLAKHLGNDQPVYAFKSRGLDGLEEFETIEEMAAQYVKELRGFQPDGPYRLGGYCFGGNIACEMARQLDQQRQRVSLLALMNCSPPNSSYDRVRWTPVFAFKFLKNLCYWAGYFSKWNPDSRRRFIRWRARTFAKRMTRWLRRSSSAGTVSRADEIVDLSALPDDRRKLWETHVLALTRYQSPPYSGRVTLFRTRGHPFLCSFDPEYGWRELALGGVTVRMVPGAHESILEEPHVRAVVEELKRELRETHSGELDGTQAVDRS